MTANKYLQKIFSLHGFDIHKIMVGGEADECGIDINDDNFKNGILQRAGALFNSLKTNLPETIENNTPTQLVTADNITPSNTLNSQNNSEAMIELDKPIKEKDHVITPEIKPLNEDEIEDTKQLSEQPITQSNTLNYDDNPEAMIELDNPINKEKVAAITAAAIKPLNEDEIEHTTQLSEQSITPSNTPNYEDKSEAMNELENPIKEEKVAAITAAIKLFNEDEIEDTKQLFTADAVVIDYQQPKKNETNEPLTVDEIEVEVIDENDVDTMNDFTPENVKDNKRTCENTYTELWNDIIVNSIPMNDFIQKYNYNKESRSIKINNDQIKIIKILLLCHPDKCKSDILEESNCTKITKFLNGLPRVENEDIRPAETSPPSSGEPPSSEQPSSEEPPSSEQPSFGEPYSQSHPPSNESNDIRTKCKTSICNLISKMFSSKISTPNNYTMPNFSIPPNYIPESFSKLPLMPEILKNILSQIRNPENYTMSSSGSKLHLRTKILEKIFSQISNSKNYIPSSYSSSTLQKMKNMFSQLRIPKSKFALNLRTRTLNKIFSRISIPNNFTMPSVSFSAINFPSIPTSFSKLSMPTETIRKIFTQVGSFLVKMPNPFSRPSMINISFSNEFIARLQKIFSKKTSIEEKCNELLTTFQNQNVIKRFGDFLTYLKIIVSLKQQEDTTLNIKRPNIKQISNGINPSYGGGFILFDSEFNIQNIIHSNYDDNNNIVMNELSIPDYSDDTVNSFMSNKMNVNFEVGRIVDVIDSIIQLRSNDSLSDQSDQSLMPTTTNTIMNS